MWSRHEIGLDRTYLAYFLFSPMIERPQMLPYNQKLRAEKPYTKPLHRRTLQVLTNRWVGNRDKELGTLRQ